jgi:ABC-2 type transport system permease protein
MAVTWASYSLPSEGKIITDMRMNEDMRKLGDGHNAADPAFAQLRRNILAQYGVDSVDDLPVNFRGLVAQRSEEELTATLNKYAEQRMSRELAQSKRLDSFGVLSPYVAISAASRALAGTDLRTHHRFLREAEVLRYEFVQGLNTAHVEKLSYVDDINRNKGEEGWKKARISAENWQVLQNFSFKPDRAATRFRQASGAIISLLIWLFGIVFIGLFAARRLQP